MQAVSSLSAALQEKYGDNTSTEPGDGVVFCLPVAPIHKIKVAVVSAKRITKLADELLNATSLQSLDVSRNDVSEWDDISQLLSRLSRLRVLNLADNPRLADSKPSCKFAPAERLQELILDGIKLQWQVLFCSIGQIGPNLRVLSLRRCCMGDTPAGELTPQEWHSKVHAIARLQALLLDDNAISEWGTVRLVCRLIPSIRELSLASNQGLCPPALSSESVSPLDIERADDLLKAATGASSGAGHARSRDERGGPLAMTAAAGTCSSQPTGTETEPARTEAKSTEPQKLAALESSIPVEKLNLSGTGLRDWEQLRSLQCIAPNLRDLRLRDVPLTKELSTDIARMLVIASLPSVFEGGSGMQTVGSETCGRLNGGAVSRSERSDAEVFAEKFWSGEWAALKKSIDAERRKLLGSKLDGAGAPGSSEQSSGASDPPAASGGAAAGGAQASSSRAVKGDGGDVIASSMMPASSVFGTKHVQDLGRLG